MDALRNNEYEKPSRQGRWGEFSHLILAGLFGGFAIALVALASQMLGEPPSVFTREPQQVLNGSFYVGALSNLGALTWFAAAAILSFAASLKPENRGALLLAALLTWAMGVDDMFMLHDRVYPKLYLNELIVYALYFGTIGVIAFRYYRQLTRATLIGIAVTVLFWGLSAMLDQFFNNIGGQLAEDGIKFTGIVVWAAAWIRQAYHDITRLAASRM